MHLPLAVPFAASFGSKVGMHHHPRLGGTTREMMMISICLFLLFKMMHVAAQPGFISIDCGYISSTLYVDSDTQIAYVPDVGFIDTGINKSISINTQFRRLSTLRSFPDGARNCYTIDAIAGAKYLVRATFVYGNYDGLNTKHIVFELHLGVNLWKTMNISDPGEMYHTDVITVATTHFLSVCLVNIGSGTPFISGLDIRKLDAAMYPDADATTSLVLSSRYNFGAPTDKFYRYPDDSYDRVWDAFSAPAEWTNISSAPSRVDNDVRYSRSFEVPPVVMSTAVTPVNSTTMQSNSTHGDAPENSFIVIFHFAELSSLLTNESRVFDIYLNGALVQDNYRPGYLKSSSVSQHLAPSPTYHWVLNATTGSTLPPILNALEVYTQMDLVQLPTDSGDVEAITAIMKEYHIKGNWIGDPCAPMKYSWNGLNCSYTPDSQRIISLNLSSRALTGIVSLSFADLTALQYLDLSYNNLTGEIPDSLGSLLSLQVLNLIGNNFIQRIPVSLLEKCKKGQLLLRIDDNPQLCDKKKKISVPIIVILSVVPVILVLVVILTGWRFKMLQWFISKTKSYKGLRIDEQLQLDNRQFTYMQLMRISGNFVRVLGNGGFGFVYHGYLVSGMEVAIKMRSQSSTQGTKEFLAEAQNLTKVHHRNLVSLLGYCMDEKCLALVYEYMSGGSLHDHLRGKIGDIRVLGWGERLRIAVQAAQGLEYLHKGCKPPIIHRDIKSSNILLGEDMEAKIADFGLSRALQSDRTHVSTAGVMGTPGYVDPEYHNTLQHNEKSDVYSFGVVLLELITGQPPIIQGAVNIHIAQYVAPKLARGELDGIVDERLQEEYDPNSVWKVLDLALRCTALTSSHRPIMPEVVAQLKDSLELEIGRRKSGNMSGEYFGIGHTSFLRIGDNLPGQGPSPR